MAQIPLELEETQFRHFYADHLPQLQAACCSGTAARSSATARSKAAEFDGVSGASVGSGKTLKVTVELADVLIDSGHEIRIDSAVEDGRDNAADVRVPLTTQGAGKPAAGRGYVQSFTYGM